MIKIIHITDLDKLKITKVKPWAINFDYEDKHYLLHGFSELGEGSWQNLYERTLDECGRYDLIFICSNPYSNEYVQNDYVKRQDGHTVVYKNIDKRYFAYKLTKRGFATGIMEEKVKEEELHIRELRNKIKTQREVLDKLNDELNDLT